MRMNIYRKKRQLERRLTPQQVRAAQLIVQNEWGEMKREDGKKHTLDEIASMVGVGHTTIYNWKKKPEFIEYVNLLTDMDLQAMRAEVNAAIMKLIRGEKTNGIPSVKAIELYLKRFALLTDRQIVESDEVAAHKRLDVDVDELLRDLDEKLS